MDLVVFKLDEKEYGIEIDQVREVIRLREITPIPQAPDFVEGVISLRGLVTPLINLRKKYRLPDKALDKSSRILVVNVNNHFIGIVVDETSDVMSISPTEIVPPDEFLKKARYLKGVGKIGERLILITDVETLLTEEEKISIEDVHSKVEVRRKKEDE